MTFNVLTLPLGMTMTNTYLLGDQVSKTAVVIDPGWQGETIVAQAEKHAWQIKAIWFTHAHFDHIGAAGAVAAGCASPPQIGLHPDDLWLWEVQGGAALFGISGVDTGPQPDLSLAHGQILRLGESEFEVRHAPGHTPGHVMFYSQVAGLLFCGDVIFKGSIGRTDLPRGSYDTLIESIQTQVMSLPDETRLLNGHGPETTVGFERAYNPFL